MAPAMMALVKFLHLVTIAGWTGGIICLPILYLQRGRIHDTTTLHRLQHLVRFTFVAVISPTAFVAISTGIALIFMRDTFVPWFSVKLAFVAALVGLHVLSGLMIIRLFDEGVTYPVWRYVTATSIASIVVLGILVVVLAKPDIPALVPAVMHEPGGLRRLALHLIPWAIP